MTKQRNRQLICQWLKLLDGSLEMEGIIELPVLSESMLPAMVPGRNIKIQRTPWNKCSSGDIIVFREGKRLTAHRLLFSLGAGRSCYCFQKGDSNTYGHFIRAERIVGRVLESQDKNGSYVDLSSRTVRHKARVIAFRQIPGTLWACSLQILRRYSAFRKEKRVPPGRR